MIDDWVYSWILYVFVCWLNSSFAIVCVPSCGLYMGVVFNEPSTRFDKYVDCKVFISRENCINYVNQIKQFWCTNSHKENSVNNIIQEEQTHYQRSGDSVATLSPKRILTHFGRAYIVWDLPHSGKDTCQVEIFFWGVDRPEKSTQ